MNLRVLPSLSVARGQLIGLALSVLLLAHSLIDGSARAQGIATSVAPARVMLLVSYHAGMAWSDDQIAGVRAKLRLHDQPIKLQLDFLDTKNVSPQPAFYQSFEDLLLSKYGSAPPRLLLATDDDALDFALRMRSKHYPGVPILFSGVSASRKKTLQAEGNISGVFDDLDVAQNLAMMLRLLPRIKRVVIVHDQSRTSLAQVRSLSEAERQRPGLQIEHLTELSAAGVQRRLRELGDSDLVFTLPFNLDVDGQVLSHEQASELWVTATSAPLAVTRDVSMRPGVLGGYLITGRQQGEILGHMALQALQHKALSDMPMLAGVGVPTFDHGQLRRWGINESALPPGAVVLYRPTPWWAGLRPYMGWLLSLFGSLLVIIGLLINGIRLRRHSEAALRMSTQNYLALFNSSTDAILVRDAASLAIVEVNPRFCSLYGYSAAEARTLSAGQISAEEGPHTGARVAAQIRRAQTEGPQFFEWRSRRKDGSLFWSEVSLAAADLPEGQRLISNVRDISDRKLLQTQAQAFHHQVTQIYQNLPVAVFVIDAEHRVTFWNEQMSRLTGVASVDIIGSTQTWRGIYPAARPCLVDVVVDGQPAAELERLYGHTVRSSADVAGALEGEACFPALGQRPEVWLRFCAAPLLDEAGRVVGAIETLVDVSALKNSQHSLLELNQQLETRVEARSRELKRAMDQLVQSEKLAALGSLVAGVAHELNTPIGNVLAAASTLNEVAVSFGKELLSGTARRSSVQAKTEQLRLAGELIERNASRAAKLIADFKQAAVDQSSSRRREFDLLELVSDTLAMLAPGLRQHRHEIRLDIAAGISLDSYPGPFEIIIGHLLDNAIRHGFAGQARGLVTIQARADATHICLRFADDGCGIEAAALSHVFEPFYTSTLGQGGSGLGLYIVYNLVTSILHGNIAASNLSPMGCCFEINIPRHAGAMASGFSSIDPSTG